MCGTCGCSGPEGSRAGKLRPPGVAPATRTVALEHRLLGKNDALAEQNRRWFARHNALALNLVSSPGAGKTALLERLVRDLSGEFEVFVIEGDQASSEDAERVRRAGGRAVQLNTGTGCHLDAGMVAGALPEFDAAGTRPRLVLIENVGNLVCPALFDLGESAKVLVASVTEGEEKPVKYPHMFRASSVVLLNKVDLLPHVRFDREKFWQNARGTNPALVTLEVSAERGDGLEDWYAWLRQRASAGLSSATNTMDTADVAGAEVG